MANTKIEALQKRIDLGEHIPTITMLILMQVQNPPGQSSKQTPNANYFKATRRLNRRSSP
jgi:hypothetical protein